SRSPVVTEDVHAGDLSLQALLQGQRAVGIQFIAVDHGHVACKVSFFNGAVSYDDDIVQRRAQTFHGCVDQVPSFYRYFYCFHSDIAEPQDGVGRCSDTENAVVVCDSSLTSSFDRDEYAG